ncbi:MAG: arylsulfatase [Pirellulaceae bacterium]
MNVLIQRLALFVVVIVLTSFVFKDSNVVAANKSTLPNIVIILVDDMGYGDPGCFNADSKIATPNIDALATAGMKFTDAHAPGPLCHMSRYGLMTGRYPFRADCGAWSKQPVIEKNQTTIASLLKSQGYRTAMVGKWHLGFDESGGYNQPLTGGPIDCGYDSFFGIRASTDIPPYFYIRGERAVAPPTETIEARSSEGWSPIQGEFSRAGGIAPNLKLADVLPRFTDEAIAVIDEHHQQGGDDPLMLYLAYPAPHTPWLPSEEFAGKSAAGMYGDFAMMVDHMIGRVLKSLDDFEMANDTLVLFSSDNGPVWYEEDVKRFDHDSSGGLRGMKADAWECGHRMPFIARWPGTVKPGSTSDQMICFTDLLATFADLTDAELSQDDGPDSFSFLPVLTGEQQPEVPIRKHMVIRSGGPLLTIRQGNWKLIDGLGSSGFSKPKRIEPSQNGPAGQLYNLADDLGETKNVYLQHPELVLELMRALQQIKDSGRSR